MTEALMHAAIDLLEATDDKEVPFHIAESWQRCATNAPRSSAQARRDPPLAQGDDFGHN
jgi:hypothetical protein